MRRIKDKPCEIAPRVALGPPAALGARHFTRNSRPSHNMRLLSLLPSLALLVAVQAAADEKEHQRSYNSYCNICSDHTMCRFQGWSGQCRGLVPRPLGPEQKEEVVAAHNSLRWVLALGEERRGSPGPQPPAANMRVMWYDDELAAIAQRWAEQCRFQHDKCRNVERFPVGQNIYLERSSRVLPAPNWSIVTGKWYDEVAMHDGRRTSSPFTFLANTGHFTQVSWAETFLVGCGISEYQDNYGGRGWYVRLYVCNYGPAGNLIGDSVYRVGNPCSQCGDQSYCYFGLCV